MIDAVLAHWDLPAQVSVSPLGRGLINQTYLVLASGDRYVLQRVNPIFDPGIHHNIAAVTEHLAHAGLTTPRLVPTRDGAPWVEHEGVWRLQTAIPGVSVDALDDPAQARAAGEFVGRWHAALRDLDHEFVALRAGVHDTPRHLASLREAVAGCGDHRLFAPVAELARGILAAAEALPPIPAGAPTRVTHGDLKINNLLFAGEAGPDRLRPVALIDLDTVAPMTLAYELGDAWRSWCNRAGEDQTEARFDLGLFAASWAGWSQGWTAAGGEALDVDERRGLLLGPEWISLELAARFAADALFERYFGWDAQAFAGRGEHNLHRARGQWSLHQALVASRPDRAPLLDL